MFCDHIVVMDAEDQDIKNRIGDKYEITKYQASREAFINLADTLITNTFNKETESKCEHLFNSLLKNS